MLRARCPPHQARPCAPSARSAPRRAASSAVQRRSGDGQRVWAWGSNENGVLGVGDNKDRFEPTPVPELRRQSFTWTDASWSMSVFINQHQQAWSCGKAGPQLLQPGRRDALVKIPSMCEPLEGKKVTKIFCGRMHALGLTSAGDVFAWGSSELGQRGHGVEGEGQELWLPAPIDALCQQGIVQMDCGLDHNVALSKDGRVWSWGYGEDGQLGHGQSEDVATRPKLLESGSLQDRHIVDVACGADFSCLLAKDGTVFTFGSNYFGQLGHGDTHDRTSPTPIASLMGVPVAELAAGAAHLLARTRNNELYACGWGEHGRLGLGDNKDRAEMTRIDFFKGRKVSRIWAGGGHSFALTDDGKLFAFGLGENGRLGTGNPSSASEPVELAFFNDKRIVHIACGLEHTVAITD